MSIILPTKRRGRQEDHGPRLAPNKKAHETLTNINKTITFKFKQLSLFLVKQVPYKV
jgi:hypothetical protein